MPRSDEQNRWSESKERYKFIDQRRKLMLIGIIAAIIICLVLAAYFIGINYAETLIQF